MISREYIEMQQITSIAWRVLKVMPVIGYVFILAGAPTVMRRKGYVLGLVALTLDMLPVICLIKAGIEIHSGDLIPDKDDIDLAPASRLEQAA